MTAEHVPDLSLTYGVLGLGRLGSSLVASFQEHGASVLTKGRAGDFDTWLQPVDVLCLCLRDDALAPFISAHRTANFTGKTVLFHSGVTPLQLLAPLAEQGARIGKWHPLQAFTNSEAKLVPAGTHWAYEGDVAALVAPWTRAWHGTLHHLQGDEWRVYHLAAVLSANYLPLFIRMGAHILEPLSENPQQALDWLKPLIEQSVAAGLDGGNALPFSGPAIRGDQATLAQHSAWLGKNQPSYQALFEQVSQAVQDFAKQQT